MASPVSTPPEDGGRPNKRYHAKYRCKRCHDQWKVKNTSHLRMICRNPDCRRTVRAYDFEVIDKLVVYYCNSCGWKLRKLKCVSQINEAPFCTICQKDMEIFLFKDLWRKTRMFGEFYCEECDRKWNSGSAWDGVGQMCKKCEVMVTPYRLKPLKGNPSSSGSCQHREELCQMCKQLGTNCKKFIPTHGDIASLDEIPLEEDDTSVITTNSSIFEGDYEEDDNGTSGEESSTPMNSDEDN